MKIDLASASALRAVIENDLEAITRTVEALSALPMETRTETETIAAAYHLHNLYNALENAFDQISRTFENHVKDLSRWHQELLAKMFLNVPPLRPAVLPLAARPFLHDLCGFRHIFRHSYDYPLEAYKIRDLRTRWQSEGPAILAALKSFADALPTSGTQ